VNPNPVTLIACAASVSVKVIASAFNPTKSACASSVVANVILSSSKPTKLALAFSVVVNVAASSRSAKKVTCDETASLILNVSVNDALVFQAPAYVVVKLILSSLAALESKLPV
jgi:hypothetical protein